MPATVYDVARTADVSIATVSRVFAKSDLVSPKTRERVLAVAAKLNYSVNRAASRLAGNKTGLLGFIAAELYNPVYIDYFHSLESIAQQRGYEVLISDSELSYEREWMNVQRMQKNGVEALMMFPVVDMIGNLPKHHAHRMKTLEMPALLMGSLMPDSGKPELTVDERAGARELAEGLSQRGWEHLIFINTQATVNRPAFERGDELRRRWINLKGKLFFQSYDLFDREDTSLRRLISLLKTAPKDTVAVTVGDEAAYFLYGALADAGISIPKNLGLASFGVSRFATYFRPQLTLVEPDHSQVAYLATEKLFSMLEGKGSGVTPHLVPPHVVWRPSTGER